ncbi:MAG: tRNA pseudouridine(13) synthase TruD [Candidatus Diapherotrites archaeon]|nr:tRNA pseudouridine(13) synthase TruD [Candidatus Diapherotrites archaeon]
MIGIDWNPKGIGGEIKKRPKDFIVEEIDLNGNVLEIETDKANWDNISGRGDQLILKLVKEKWDTLFAIKKLSKQLGFGEARIGYAGTKDKYALTSQRISIWEPDLEKLKQMKIKDIYLYPLEYSNERIKLGDLKGNLFKITIRKIPKERKIEFNLNLLPNFFGPQRFGSGRAITHEVGRKIITGNLKAAVLDYIAETSENEMPEIQEARNKMKALLEDQDYKEAIKICPTQLKHELTLLHHLSENYRDYGGALRKLPRKLTKMFIHAYQAYLFNQILSEYLKTDINYDVEAIIPGYKSEYSGGKLGKIERKVMKKSGITFEDFKIGKMPEFGSEGLKRKLFMTVNDFKVENISEDETNQGFNKATITFWLEKGSYATLVTKAITGEWV